MADKLITSWMAEPIASLGTQSAIATAALAAAGIVVTEIRTPPEHRLGGRGREHACDTGEEINNPGERARLPDEARQWPLG
jgi:hypothetical protein